MSFVLILTGTLTANVNVFVPAESRVYIADNRTAGAFSVTFRTPTGNGVAVAQGQRTLIYCDGETVFPVGGAGGGGGGTSVEGQWDWTTATTGAPASGRLGVNSGVYNVATEVHVAHLGSNGTDYATVLASLLEGDDFYIQDQNQASISLRYRVSGPAVSQGTWSVVPVSWLVGSGTLTNNAVLYVRMQRTYTPEPAAPPDAAYLVASGNTLLTGERVVTDTPTITWDLATAGQAKAIIPPDAVTYAHLQPVTSSRLLGRYAADAGDVQEITPGSGLVLDASGVLSAVPGGGAQPLDATLTALAGVTTAADTMEYFTGVDVAASTPLSPLARTLLDDTTQAQMQATIGLVPGTTVQPFDATLAALAGVTTGEDVLQFFTGTDTVSTTPFSPLARALLDDTTQAEMQATLGVSGGGGGSYTDEQAQDAVGAMLTDSATLDFTYDDTTPSLTGSVKDASITEAKLVLADVTTHNVSAVQHGLVPKAPGTSTQYLDGTGAWSTPAGGGGGGDTLWARVDTSVGTLADGLLAFWRMEETSGTRVDSVAAFALVPNGGTSSGVGQHGTAVQFSGVAGSYLQVADHATLSVGAAQSFTLACWVCFDAAPENHTCIVGKGNTSSAYVGAEYLLKIESTTLRFFIANGSAGAAVNSGFVPTVGTWFFAIGWLDAAANVLSIQINGGTPVSVACPYDSYDSAFGMEIGRSPNWSGSPIVNGRVDDVMFYKRLLTAAERTALWNSGLGLDYSELGGGIALVHPQVTTDVVVAGSTTLTASEPLESARGIKLGTSTGTAPGIVHWSGTDLEVRKAGAWVSLTSVTDPELLALSVLTSAPDTLPYFTGPGAAALAPFTAAGRTLVGAADAAAQRTALELGTMAMQDASAVAITGGTAHFGGKATPYWLAAPNAQVDFFYGPVQMETTLRVHGSLGVGMEPSGNKISLRYERSVINAIVIEPSADTGLGSALYFHNAALGNVGSISTTATATAYNTTSDLRLKHAVTPLTGALDWLRRPRPVGFFWNANDAYDEGFVAHELQQVASYAVTGEPDAVHDDGSIRPQQVDNSKLVPRLTAACQALLAEVEALRARIEALEVATP